MDSLIEEAKIRGRLEETFFNPKTIFMTKISPPFGGHVTKEQAEGYYKNFVKIKGRSIEKIRANLSDDESSRYHSGIVDENGDCCFLDSFFLFDKKSISRVLNVDPKTIVYDGLVIFLGSRNMEDSPDPEDPTQYNDVDGRPTSLIFPFNIELDEKTKTPTGNIKIMLDDGAEHPGTGGGSGGGGGTQEPITIAAANQNNLPIPSVIPEIYPMSQIKSLYEYLLDV